MRKFKYSFLLLSCAFLISGCGSDTTEEENVETLVCTYSGGPINENNSIELKYEDDKIIEATMSFESDSGFGQDYADSVCEAYEGNEGITCEATATEDGDDVHSSYKITGTDDEGTRAFLEFRETFTGENLEEMKASIESASYTCE